MFRYLQNKSAHWRSLFLVRFHEQQNGPKACGEQQRTTAWVKGGALCSWMNNHLKTADAMSHTLSFLLHFSLPHPQHAFFASPVFVFERRRHSLTAALTAHGKYVTESRRMLTKHIFGMTSIKRVLFVPTPVTSPLLSYGRVALTSLGVPGERRRDGYCDNRRAKRVCGRLWECDVSGVWLSPNYVFCSYQKNTAKEKRNKDVTIPSKCSLSHHSCVFKDDIHINI